MRAMLKTEEQIRSLVDDGVVEHFAMHMSDMYVPIPRYAWLNR